MTICNHTYGVVKGAKQLLLPLQFGFKRI